MESCCESSWVTVFSSFFLCVFRSGKKREEEEGVTVTVAVLVSCQLFGVVLVSAFITIDGAGLDLAILVTL